MSEPQFREIQLSGKQLFFLFMASIVMAVVIFLLGVSVGRGVRDAAGASVDLSAATDTQVPANMPPPTQTKQGDLNYHETLQGGAAPAGAQPKPGEQPPPTTEEPTAPAAAGTKPADAKATPPPAAPPVAAAKPAEPPPTKAPEKPADKTKALTPQPGVWFVQVGAYGTKQNADRVAAGLKTKGFDAYVDDTGPARSQYRVRVGKFANRADADQASTRLKREGFGQSSVLR